MQLTRGLFFAVLALLAPLFRLAAWADGELAVRGVYYKERSTRVAQPMLDARFEVGEDGELTASFLVDSITSASVASGAAGEPFTELRYEAGGSYFHRVGGYRVGAAARQSIEPDYRSSFASFRGEAELAQRNTLAGLGVALGRDQLTNRGDQSGVSAPIEGTLTTVLASANLSQVLSPVLVAAVTYDAIYLQGFQENAYRTVSAGGLVERERVPETRLRNALFAQLRRFVTGTETTLVTGYRLYFDDWGLLGHTPELRLIQSVAQGVDVGFRFRYHRQGAAYFYKTVYDTNDPVREPYLTDDVKLSAFSSQSYGVQMTALLSALGLQDDSGMRADLVLEYRVQNNRFGDALIAQLAFTVPFVY